VKIGGRIAREMVRCSCDPFRSLTLAALGAGLSLRKTHFTWPLRITKHEFENGLVRVSRVSYQAHDKAPMHDHPALPTVYVYTAMAADAVYSRQDWSAYTACCESGLDPFPSAGQGESRGGISGANPTEYLPRRVEDRAVDVPDHAVRLRPSRVRRAATRGHSRERQFRIVGCGACGLSGYCGIRTIRQ